jgi:hypothetical protein
MPQFKVISNDIAHAAAAKLKSDLEASQAKLKADVEAIWRRNAPSTPANKSEFAPATPEGKEHIAPAPRRARHSSRSRLAALTLGCGLIVGVAIVAVWSVWNLNRAEPEAPNANAVAVAPPLGTMKRMNAIRDSFANH